MLISYNVGCTFQDNSCDHYGGAVILFVSTGNVSIIDCTFQNNSARYYGGGAFIKSRSTEITDCTFHNNNADSVGGGVYFDGGSSNVSITNSTFYINNSQRRGAISIRHDSNVLIDTSSFTNNTSEAGAAIYAYLDEDYINRIIFTPRSKFGHLILQNVIVKDNHCPSDKCAGAIYYIGVIMEIIGSTTTGSHFVSNSPQGAVQGENGLLVLLGYITFANNTGINGGAISLSNNAPVYVYENCDLTFFQNIANGYGGAIYNNGKSYAPIKYTDEFRKNSCILGYYANDRDHCNNFRITFIHNHAQQGGHAVYATPINSNCYDCFNSETIF